jgi:alpha-tubulin suppressor-like RCC1 family protein
MDSVQSVAAGGNHSLILKTDGTCWATGDNRFGQLGDGTTTKTLTHKLIIP